MEAPQGGTVTERVAWDTAEVDRTRARAASRRTARELAGGALLRLTAKRVKITIPLHSPDARGLKAVIVIERGLTSAAEQAKGASVSAWISLPPDDPKKPASNQHVHVALRFATVSLDREQAVDYGNLARDYYKQRVTFPTIYAPTWPEAMLAAEILLRSRVARLVKACADRRALIATWRGTGNGAATNYQPTTEGGF